MKQENIRNFSIIAHIDHCKSNLADRILEITNAIDKREAKDQLLDNMDLERERGITIKLNAVKLKYNYEGEDYILHLIDTPGHVDFSYEVSRSLAACEGAILVVDAAQGIEAQTLANLFLALENNLTIIPVINKIDLPNADPERVKKELIDMLGFSEDEIILTSAKEGIGIKELVETIIKKVPAPKGNKKDKLQALIFDSYYDAYRGIVLSVRVVNGTLKVGDTIRMMNNKATYEVNELCVHTPKEVKVNELSTGCVGIVSASIKKIDDVTVGDTITLDSNPATSSLPGYKAIKPMVFCGLYPIESSKYPDLRDALEKLKLNDAALEFQPETSKALGFGFRCGFLGLLHLEIIEERIEREFKLDLIVTNPSTDYRVTMTSGEELDIRSASSLPDATKILEIREPWVKGEIITPKEYIGAILDLIITKRGRQKNISYIDTRAIINFEAPMANLLTDFYDQLKSSTSGYASFNYELAGYQAEDLVRVDFLVAGERVDALSVMAHRSEADAIGRTVTKKLKEVIPRQNFEVALQAAIGARIIARETLGAFRKDVTVKIHTGDRDRKAKLVEKQKRGKARMKRFGKVDIPSEAFTVMLKRD